jgi:hypothetical protein
LGRPKEVPFWDESNKPGPGGNASLLLTPLQFLDRLAALVPPPRVHRHRYFGVLAPNSPLRAAVTALAPAAAPTPPAPPPAPPAAEPAHRRAARYAWALLLARIYDRRKSLWDEVVPLVCPRCGAAMRIIAFISDGPTVRDILAHCGEPTAPPRIAPARGPPLWEAADPEHDPGANPLPPPIPAFEFDQRLSWWPPPSPSLLTRVRRRAASCRWPPGASRGHAGARGSPAPGATTAPRRPPTTSSARRHAGVNP